MNWAKFNNNWEFENKISDMREGANILQHAG